MEVNSHGLIVINVFYQGIICLEEIEQHLEEVELLQGLILTTYLERTLCRGGRLPNGNYKW